jgi:hypothetical protein
MGSSSILMELREVMRRYKGQEGKTMQQTSLGRSTQGSICYRGMQITFHGSGRSGNA